MKNPNFVKISLTENNENVQQRMNAFPSKLSQKSISSFVLETSLKMIPNSLTFRKLRYLTFCDIFQFLTTYMQFWCNFRNIPWVRNFKNFNDGKTNYAARCYEAKFEVRKLGKKMSFKIKILRKA